MVTQENLVGQDHPTLLTTIVSVDPLYIYFDAPERDLIDYQRGLQTQALPSPTSRTLPVEVGVATEDATDLIVMGVHGRNALDVMLFGSTTNQVVRRATCPVLTLRQ